MQRPYYKFIGLSVLIFFFTTSASFAQTSTYRLKTADSLFAAKRFTQSFEHYETILNQHQYTPVMLLKMAFIQEGLNHIGRVMYYLNVYYLATHDKAALDKMEELAKKHRLDGYKTTDADRFFSFYHDNFQRISIGLGAVAVFLFSIIFYMRQREKQRPVFATIMLVIVLLGLGYHINLAGKYAAAIITAPQTYLMDGPSAGASVLDIVSDGHRVVVLGHRDVWVKIKWNENVGYVRENNLLPVEL
ncbi:MAG: SH3 domain-containing protein [Cyclobacteriaceae bacterium]|nr:SH3 domain-containing protein [Cyclobacteriaceae bacterium]